MAKHKSPHKYMYTNLSKFTKGWRCMLEGCDHHLPKNVEETIIGRLSICWSCEDIFRIDENIAEHAMKKESNGQPFCYSCSMTDADREMENRIERNITLGKTRNMTPEKRRMLENMGFIKKIEPAIEDIPADEEHAVDCEVSFIGICTCKS